MTVASLGDRFPMSLRQFFRGQEVRSNRRDPLIQRHSVMYQKTGILVCMFVSRLSQGTVMHFWAVQFGHPCRDTSSCLCFILTAPFSRDYYNLGT